MYIHCSGRRILHFVSHGLQDTETESEDRRRGERKKDGQAKRSSKFCCFYVVGSKVAYYFSFLNQLTIYLFVYYYFHSLFTRAEL